MLLSNQWESPEDISRIVGITKRNFTRTHRTHQGTAPSPKVWQERFWDHIIRNDADLDVDYIHFNPVKHGLVQAPENYPHSTFAMFVANGEYEIGWGHEEPQALQQMNMLIEPAFLK